MRKGGIFVLSIILLFVLIGFVSSEGGGGEVPQPSSGESGGGGGVVSNFVNVSYDSDLLRAFEDRDFANDLMRQKNFIGLEIIDGEVWARVMVVLKDNSGIEVFGNKTEKRKLVNQRVEWFGNETEKLVPTLSMKDVKEINKNSGGFSALVSEEGLDELIDKEGVEKVIWSQYKPELLLEESVPLINADDVWNTLGYNGSDVKVCIIDSGIDTDNMYLEDSIVDEKCYNSDNGCPNNLASDDSAEDEHGHGTQVAGVVASEHSFEKGIAHGADLYVVRVTDDDGEYSNDPFGDIANAIDWCRNQGVDVDAALDSIEDPCSCGSWSVGSCGVGSCNSEQKPWTRSCTPSACDSESMCVYDEDCSEEEEGQLSNCTEAGYESCIEYEYGDCDVSIAINDYAENTNDIGCELE